MTLQGLSLDQAPPYFVPNLFFLSGLSYMTVASIFAIFMPFGEIASRLHPSSLALIHIFTLGVFANIMMGASFQMLPVVAGARYPVVVTLSLLVYAFFQVGTISLIVAFLTFEALLFQSAALFLALGVFIFTASTIFALRTSSYKESSNNGIRTANIAFLVTLMLALFLIASLLGVDFDTMRLLSLHSSFGAFGWIFLLILSVSFWVIPMFYVTSPYPKYCKKIILPLSVVLLIFNAIYLLSLPLVAFGLSTLRRVRDRKRKLKDGVVYFWTFGMLSLLVFSLLLGLSYFFDGEFYYYFGLFFGCGFVLSVMLGMLLKIVPFLTWFHLSYLGVLDAPMPGEMIEQRAIIRAFYLHLSGVLLLIFAPIFEPFFNVGAAVIFINSVYILALIVKTQRIYFKRRTLSS